MVKITDYGITFSEIKGITFEIPVVNGITLTGINGITLITTVNGIMSNVIKGISVKIAMNDITLSKRNRKAEKLEP